MKCNMTVIIRDIQLRATKEGVLSLCPPPLPTGAHVGRKTLGDPLGLDIGAKGDKEMQLSSFSNLIIGTSAFPRQLESWVAKNL